jgi:tetratricopeptide (TPR) repeat protein
MDHQKHLPPEQIVSDQVRKITDLSLSDQPHQALKRALELVQHYGNYALVHRCLAKVYQRMDQREEAIKHHEIADELSRQIFRDYNPHLNPSPQTPPSSQIPTKKTLLPPPPSPLLPGFDHKWLRSLEQHLIESTKEEFENKKKNHEIEYIPTIKIGATLPPQAPSSLSNSSNLISSEKPLFSMPQEKDCSLSNSQLLPSSPLTLHPPLKTAPSFSFTLPPHLTLKQALCLFREAYIQQVYSACDRDLEKAAQQLQITPETLSFVLQGF